MDLLIKEIIDEISVFASSLLFLKERNEGSAVYKNAYERLPYLINDILESDFLSEREFIKILGNISE